jgi:hypothetical protein
MKNSVLVIGALVFGVSSQVLAQEGKPLPVKVGFQLRIDATNEKVEETDKDDVKTQKFVVNRAKLIFSGDLTPRISYTLLLHASSQALHGTSGPDGSMDALQVAYFDIKAFEGLQFKVGKILNTVLSVENDYSGMDEYYYSLLNNRLYETSVSMAGLPVSKRLTRLCRKQLTFSMVTATVKVPKANPIRKVLTRAFPSVTTAIFSAAWLSQLSPMPT